MKVKKLGFLAYKTILNIAGGFIRAMIIFFNIVTKTSERMCIVWLSHLETLLEFVVGYTHASVRVKSAEQLHDIYIASITIWLHFVKSFLHYIVGLETSFAIGVRVSMTTRQVGMHCPCCLNLGVHRIAYIMGKIDVLHRGKLKFNYLSKTVCCLKKATCSGLHRVSLSHMNQQVLSQRA